MIHTYVVDAPAGLFRIVAWFYGFTHAAAQNKKPGQACQPTQNNQNHEHLNL
jgi:hypothetical protein